MKITAGLGSIDEYERYVEAGADELFCGIVPYSWSVKNSVMTPLNRREVLYYNVQIGAFSELKILGRMVEQLGVPITIAFNSLYYTGEQMGEVADIIRKCMDCGFNTFIIADPALILYLRKSHIECNIHLSGEVGTANHLMMEHFAEYNVSRYIFNRKNTPEEIAGCISYVTRLYEIGKIDIMPEFEAFALNEMCHFTGAYCNSLHCDELTHMCKVPYKLGRISGIKHDGEFDLETPYETEENGYVTGQTGCGLCALGALERAGITHLKLVGRGNYIDYMERDIVNLKNAVNILNKSDIKDDYMYTMKESIFGKLGVCSGNCYYR